MKNFVISRAELIAVTGIKRTKTFELQQHGHLRVLSHHAQQSWFCLAQVLEYAASLHGMPPPDAQCVEKYARMVIEARLKGQVRRA